MPVRPAKLALAAAVLLATPVAVRADPPVSGFMAPVASRSGNADARAGQVRAAQANAMAGLRDSVLRLEVVRGLHVGEVVDRTDSAPALAQALSAAGPLGSPRWVDEQTCQVQVTIPGAAVADAVVAMAMRYPGGRLPARPDAVAARLAAWRATAFTAVGNSVAGGAAVQQARPMAAGGRWGAVPEPARRQAVADAQADAVRRTLDDLARAVGSLSLGPTPARAAFDRPAVAGMARGYLDAQPVTKVEFLDADLSVTVTMTVDGPGLTDALRRAVADDQPRMSAGVPPGDWDRVGVAVDQGVPASVVGTASAGPPVATNLPTVVLPMEPPAGVDDVLTAEGTAEPIAGQRSPLKVKGLAEAAALAQLRDRLLAVRVSPTATLADAARADPQMAAAVSRVLLDAGDAKVTWLAGGAVRVRVYLNLRHAWDQLRAGS